MWFYPKSHSWLWLRDDLSDPNTFQKDMCDRLHAHSALPLDLRAAGSPEAQARELGLCSTMVKTLTVKQTHGGQGAIPGEPPVSKGKEAAKYAEQT